MTDTKKEKKKLNMDRKMLKKGCVQETISVLWTRGRKNITVGMDGKKERKKERKALWKVGWGEGSGVTNSSKQLTR